MLKIGKALLDIGIDFTGGYIEVSNENVDLYLRKGYYEIIDADNNQYSIFVNDNLEISDNQVIKDIAGYVRLQGVTFPCKVAIRNFPTLSGNTKDAFIEIESDFPSVIASKNLKKVVW